VSTSIAGEVKRVNEVDDVFPEGEVHILGELQGVDGSPCPEAKFPCPPIRMAYKRAEVREEFGPIAHAAQELLPYHSYAIRNDLSRISVCHRREDIKHDPIVTQCGREPRGCGASNPRRLRLRINFANSVWTAIAQYLIRIRVILRCIVRNPVSVAQPSPWMKGAASIYASVICRAKPRNRVPGP